MQLYAECVCVFVLAVGRISKPVGYLLVLRAIKKEFSKPPWQRIGIGGIRDRVDR